MSKNFIFANSMPRAGQTLVSAVINSNKNIQASANSIVPDILWRLDSSKKSSLFTNFPDEQSFDNVATNVFDLYYKDWKCNTIIDHGPWGTPFNLGILKSLIDRPKFFILQRPLLECIASFVKVKIDNHTLTKDSIEGYVENELMSMNGLFNKWIVGIDTIVKALTMKKIEQEDCLMLSYNDLVKSPQTFFKKLSKFAGEEIKIPEKITQFKAQNVKYNDESINMKNLHKIRPGKIKQQKYDMKNYLTPNLIKRYKNFKYGG